MAHQQRPPTMPGVRIVLLSGYTAETLDVERIVSRGAGFVAKPLSGRELLAALDARHAAVDAAMAAAPTAD